MIRERIRAVWQELSILIVAVRTTAPGSMSSARFLIASTTSVGSLASPLRGVQTVTVPAGGAVITEFKVDVPGNYMLVDHALSRAELGLVGMLHVEGPTNPEILDGKIEPGSTH
jgi:hypothetical protein